MAVKFCWHCAKKFRGNFVHQYRAEDGNVYSVHADCKRILEGGFNHKISVDEEDWGTEICVGCGHMEDWCECRAEVY